MATATITPPAGPPPFGPLRRFTLAEYERLIADGFFAKGDRVVLLDGFLVTKMTKGDRHVAATKLTVESLRSVVPAGRHVSKGDPIALPAGPDGTDSAPEPDVAVVRGGIRDYSGRKPNPGDIALMVEIADSSLPEDRRGLARYAWASIPIAWIVNLPAGVVEVYTRPTGPDDDPRYADCHTYAVGDEIPVVIDGQAVGRVPLADLLP
jgi:hypothetical protein